MDRIITENENLKIFIEFHAFLINYMGNTAEEFAHIVLEEQHFSVMVIDDYPKNKRCLRINSVSEFMDLCKGDRFIHLFLEKGITSQLYEVHNLSPRQGSPPS